MIQLHYRPALLGFLFIFLILFTACEKDDPNAELQERLDAQKVEIEDYLAENTIDAEEVNGYYLETITENPDGREPATNNVVAIYYELHTLDGQLIEKREAAAGDEPAKFPFRQDRVLLPGRLYEIVAEMREGEEVRAYLPFDRAYGAYSIDNKLPAYSAVIMKVTLAEVLTEAEQKLAEDTAIKAYLAEQGLQNADSLEGGVYYAETEAGTEPEVGSNSTVGLRYKGVFLDGEEFDSNTDAGDEVFEVRIGQNQVITGFETAIREMSLNEEGTTLIPSHEAYGSGYFVVPYELMEDLVAQRYVPPTFAEIKPYSILRFDLEVEDID